MWTTIESLHRWKADSSNSLHLIIFLPTFFLLLVSCQTAPKKETPSHQGVVWRYQTDIYVDQRAQSNKVRGFLDVVEGEGFRLEVLSTADVPVATIVMTDSEVSYALYLDKVFYTGKTNPHALDPIFPLQIKPSEIEAIFREQVLPEQKCNKDESQNLVSCTAQSPVAYEVLWEKRGIAGPLAGRPTRITLKLITDQIEIRFYIQNVNREESNKGLLLLTSPKNFSTRRVPEK